MFATTWTSGVELNATLFCGAIVIEQGGLSTMAKDMISDIDIKMQY